MYNDFEIKIPGATGLKPEAKKDPKAWVLGAANQLGSLRDRPTLKPTGHGWDANRPTFDFQRLIDKDSQICVSDSTGNACEYGCNELKARDTEVESHLKQIGMIDEQGSTKVNNRIIAVGSGTDPNAGNSVTEVAEFVRKNFLAPQSAWPWDNSFTSAQFYSGLTQEIIDAGKPFSLMLGIEHEWLPNKDPYFSQTHTPEQLIKALTMGTPTISVDGNYERDEEGLISSANLGEMKLGKLYYWNHRVTLVDFEPGKFWVIHDHYTNQIIKFRWDYPFGNGKLFFIIKKKGMPKIYKQKGNPALYALNPDKQLLVPFGDGAIAGGELFKTLYGVNSYKEIPRVLDPKTGEDWDTLPFPVSAYLFTSTPTQGAVIEE